ncbi:MAG: ABC transporter substrate-binding protein [Trueperaceae bacterium]|nr:ABC transporter substrate-binding protein [Trueperaceae bacterium]
MKKVFLALAAAILAFASAQEINYITGNRGSDVDYATRKAQEYMADHPGVTINVIQGPESATDRAQQYLQFFEAQSGEVDLFEIDVIWPGDMAEHLVNLYDYAGYNEAAPDFFPAIVANNTVDGRLVGIPYFTDAGLLYYRQDLLDKYSLSVPTTWDELTAAAQTIQDGERAEGNPDFWGFVWQGNAYEGLTCDALEWVASNGGGEIVEVQEDGSKLITINNENAIAALEKAASWVGTISPNGVTGYQEEDAREVWQSGNAAFMRNWPYAYSLGNGEDSAVAGKFGVAALPMGSGEGARNAGTLGGWQLAVSKYSANPEVAADFALFLTNHENQLDNAITRSLLPTRTAVYEDQALLDSGSAFMAEFLPVFQGAVARPSTATAPNYLQASQYFFSAVHSVLTGEEDAETALALLELDLESLTGFPTAQ